MADDNVAVELEEEFHAKKKSLFNQKIQEGRKLVFVEGTFSFDIICKMFGDVVEDIGQSLVNVSEKSRFTHIDDSDFVTCIVLLGNNEALLRRYDSSHIDHVDMMGNVIRKLDIDCWDFIMLHDWIIFTDFNGKTISRYSFSGTVTEIHNTAPLHPDGLCTSSNDCVLICLAPCNSNEITTDCMGEVDLLDSKGRVLQKYIYSDGGEKLFTCPTRVAQNITMDICVVDGVDNEFRSRLVVVSLTSVLRFTYEGQVQLKEKFSVTAVCCDRQGRILLTDYYNRAVHVLRYDGCFLQYILTKESPILEPRCLALKESTLWLGCEDGIVKVYEYVDKEPVTK